MVTNQLKTKPPSESIAGQQQPAQQASKTGFAIHYQWIAKNMLFFLFLAFLAVLYIANGHMADKTIRNIDETSKQIKELKYEYKTLKARLMNKTREAEIVKTVTPLGLFTDTVFPKRIKLITPNEK